MSKVLAFSISFVLILCFNSHPQNYGGWTSASPMKLPRMHHASVILPNGNILVCGGETDSSVTITNTSEIYDYKNNTWKYTDTMNVGRYYHQLILLDSNRVLAIGGYNIKSCEIYNIKENKWSFTDSLKVARLYGATTSLLKNGKVLVTGGYNYISNDIYLRDVELFDPQENQWSTVDSLKVGRYGHTATLLDDGKLLIAGGAGKECEIFDPSIEKWSIINSLNVGRFEQSAIILSNGNILISGGRNNNDLSNQWIDSCEVYDPTKDKWTIVTSMYTARAEHSSIMLNNGLILFVGGSFGNESWELYNPNSFNNIYINNYPVIQSIQEIKILNNGNVIGIGGLTWTATSTPILSATSICEIFSPSIDGIDEKTINPIKSFELSQNYPNPFNPTTVIEYQLPKDGFVSLKVFDILGKEVRTLVNGYRTVGKYSIGFDGTGLSSGIYFYQLKSNGFSAIKKMILTK